MDEEKAVEEQVVVEEKQPKKRDWLVIVDGDGEARNAARDAGYRATHGRGEVEIQFLDVTEAEAKKVAAKFGKVLRTRAT